MSNRHHAGLWKWVDGKLVPIAEAKRKADGTDIEDAIRRYHEGKTPPSKP